MHKQEPTHSATNNPRAIPFCHQEPQTTLAAAHAERAPEQSHQQDHDAFSQAPDVSGPVAGGLAAGEGDQAQAAMPLQMDLPFATCDIAGESSAW